ncbi:hypothetical protein MauCBS54593_003348 [Microsporum audouinii]
MACPESVTIKSLSGRFKMNKQLSDNSDQLLSLQGLGWVACKAFRMMPIEIDIRQFEDGQGATRIEVDNIVGGGALGRSKETRQLDWNAIERQHTSFGNIRSRSCWIELHAITDAFLLRGWEGELNVGGLIFSRVESIDHGWIQEQVWGFQEIDGQKRYVRRIVIIKGEQRREARFVFDWVAALV